MTSWLEQFRPQTPTAPPIEKVDGASGFEATVITGEVNNVLRATEGTRNHTVNRAAFNLAQILPPDMWRAQLEAAAASTGLSPTEIARTIDSGIRGAERNPRPPERMPRGGARPVQDLPSLDGYSDTPEAPERSSWRHVDPATAALLAENPPAFLQREDGSFLWYPGKVNGLIGESESGKTWVALLAVQQALAAGHAVLYLDFEDTYAGIVGRLTSMGADVSSGFYYTAPDVPMGQEQHQELMDDIEEIRPSLIVLDGVNAAMTLLGLDLNSNTDATIFSQRLLRPLSNTGAAVGYVDHLPKNREFQGKGGIGAQAKRAMTTGCAIRVDVVEEFGKGQDGRLKLTVDKDRAGLVRAVAGAGKHLGQAVLTSELDGSVTLSIDHEGGAKPTILMARILDYLDRVGGATKRQIRANVEGRDEALMRAIGVLEDEGKVDITTGPNRSLLVTRAVVPGHEGGSGNHGSVVPPRIKGGTTNQSDGTDELRWDQR